MLKIIDNKIYRDDKKIGWIDGHHVRAENDVKLGYYQDNFVFHEDTHKTAYIRDNELVFENGNPSISLEKINEEVQGTIPLIEKCAIYVLLEE